jgi:hypothetical protein
MRDKLHDFPKHLPGHRGVGHLKSDLTAVELAAPNFAMM